MKYQQWCPTCMGQVVKATRGIPSTGTCENGHTFDRSDALSRIPTDPDRIAALEAHLAEADARAAGVDVAAVIGGEG